MKVSELMTRDPVTVGPGATCGEAATLMKQEDCGSLPIVEGGRLVGIVTDRDIVIRAVAAGKDPKRCLVAEVMSADPLTMSPDDDVAEAERVMAERQVRRLPGVRDGKLVGILVTAHIARAESERKIGETIKEISGAASRKASHARG